MPVLQRVFKKYAKGYFSNKIDGERNPADLMAKYLSHSTRLQVSSTSSTASCAVHSGGCQRSWMPKIRNSSGKVSRDERSFQRRRSI